MCPRYPPLFSSSLGSCAVGGNMAVMAGCCRNQSSPFRRGPCCEDLNPSISPRFDDFLPMETSIDGEKPWLSWFSHLFTNVIHMDPWLCQCDLDQDQSLDHVAATFAAGNMGMPAWPPPGRCELREAWSKLEGKFEPLGVWTRSLLIKFIWPFFIHTYLIVWTCRYVLRNAMSVCWSYSLISQKKKQRHGLQSHWTSSMAAPLPQGHMAWGQWAPGMWLGSTEKSSGWGVVKRLTTWVSQMMELDGFEHLPFWGIWRSLILFFVFLGDTQFEQW